MKKLILISFLITNLLSLELDSLYKDIKNSSNKELQDEQKRVEQFLKDKNEQQKILNQTKAQLKTAEQETQQLKKLIEANEKILTQKETELNEKAGDIGQMFGSLRQTSSDFLTVFNDSFTIAQYPNVKEIFQNYSNSSKLPNTNELTLFWKSMLEEIVHSGEVATFNTSIIKQNGEKENVDVTRIGQFAAFSDGKYLDYANDLNSLVELQTQPDSSIQSNAQDFEQSHNEIMNIMIDPTRGTLLSMLGNSPTMVDRINQGGIVGYIILLLGGLGIIFAIYKMIILNITHKKINAQIKNLSNPNTNNSLGKIAKVFYENVNKSINELEIKIAEAILKESNSVKKGQSFVKLLAAVTPLLGLLGTVTGMIATFQAITLFGTGDPKLMAGGISTALITTVLGLVTAIPLLFAYTYISSKSDAITSILEEQSVGMLAMNVNMDVDKNV